jgi:hypothetical protein
MFLWAGREDLNQPVGMEEERLRSALGWVEAGHLMYVWAALA